MNENHLNVPGRQSYWKLNAKHTAFGGSFPPLLASLLFSSSTRSPPTSVLAYPIIPHNRAIVGSCGIAAVPIVFTLGRGLTTNFRQVRSSSPPSSSSSSRSLTHLLLALTKQKKDPWNGFVGGAATGLMWGVRYSAFLLVPLSRDQMEVVD
jgi:hypothetical protein